MKLNLKKLESFDPAFFKGKNYFDDDGTQNYLVFQPVYKYFDAVGFEITSWKSKGLFNEEISSVINSDGAVPKIVYDNARIKVEFNGHLLMVDKVIYNYGLIINIYIVYRSILATKDSSVTLQNCLFGAVKLTKNADIDKCKYSVYGIGFDSRGSFTHPSGRDGRNVIIFEADLSSSTHANDKTRSILVLGKDFVQGIDGTTIDAEKIYSTNFTVDNKTFCLSLHYNGDSSYLFANGKEIINLKAKDSEITPYPLCLGNISKDLSRGYMKKTGLAGYVCYFSVDYLAISNDKILDIHNYLLKKNNII